MHLENLKHLEDIRLTCKIGHIYYDRNAYGYKFTDIENKDLKAKKEFDIIEKQYNEMQEKIRRKITKINKNRIERDEEDQNLFYADNYPLCNIYKGEPSDSDSH